MKNKLKLLFLVPCLLLASCNFKYAYTIKGLVIGGDAMDEIDDGIDDAGTYNIKVWVDDKIVSLTQTQIQEFVSTSGGKYTINATVEPQSEGTAAITPRLTLLNMGCMMLFLISYWGILQTMLFHMVIELWQR